MRCQITGTPSMASDQYMLAIDSHISLILRCPFFTTIQKSVKSYDQWHCTITVDLGAIPVRLSSSPGHGLTVVSAVHVLSALTELCTLLQSHVSLIDI